MASTSGKNGNSNRIIHFLSPRSGGPYKQHALLAKALRQYGYSTYHHSGVVQWVRLHLNHTDIIISGIPFIWIPNKRNFLLNIRGDYRKEVSWRNPLALLYPYNIRHAKKIIVPSEFLKKQLELSDAHVIPNAIERLRDSAPRQESPHPLRIGTSMSFDFFQKAEGVKTIMHAMQKIKEKESFEFHIFGEGKYLPNIQKYAQNYKRSFGYNIIFHGHQKDILRKLALLDIFVYWSVFDNMPNALLDALACGLPIVANDHGAFGEILGDKNILAASPEEFANDICKLTTSPLKRKEYSAKSRDRSHLFLISNIIQKWIKALPQ